MPLAFRSNLPSLGAQLGLRRASDDLAVTFQRLSSGLRINSAKDDPAGLALADLLRSDTRVAAVALRNANDGIAIASVADNGLDAIGSVLTRMAELAQQSANGAITNAERSALSTEFLALGSEVERIAVTTTFNNVGLLSNSSSITLQVGLRGDANSQITMQSVLATLASVGLASSGTSRLSFSIIDLSTAGSQYAAQNALSAVAAALDSISSRRGVIGASESRLSQAISFLQVARTNFQAAESRIRDADVADEVAKMTRLQVMQQGATAILAQANLQPQLVLRLLN